MSTISQRMSRSERRNVRQTVAQSVNPRCLQLRAAVEFKAEDDEDGRLFFEGMANTSNVDRGGDIVKPSAFRASLKSFLKNPVLFFQHDWDMPIGQITEARVTESGLFVKGFIMATQLKDGREVFGPWPDFINWVRALVESEVLRSLSVGFRMLDSKIKTVRDPMTGKDRQIREITKLELLEISLVALPMNRESQITPLSFLQKEFGDVVAQSLFSIETHSGQSTHEEDSQGGGGEASEKEAGSAETPEHEEDELAEAIESFIESLSQYSTVDEDGLRSALATVIESSQKESIEEDPEDDDETSTLELVSLEDREETEQMHDGKVLDLVSLDKGEG